MACHKSWPVAEIKRLHACSSFQSDFLAAKGSKLARLWSFFLSGKVLSLAESWQTKVVPTSGVQVGVSTEPVRALRLILPFTARWDGVASKIRSLNTHWRQLLLAAGLNCTASVTFKRGSKPLWMLARSRVAPDFDLLKKVRTVVGR